MGNFLQNGVLSLSRTTLGAWFFSRVGHHIDRWTYAASGQQANFTSWLAGVPLVMVEAIGRKSGKVYLIPLVAIQRPEDPENFAIIASNWGQNHHPAWYYNLSAQSETKVTIKGQVRRYAIHEAKDAEYQSYWDTAARLIANYKVYEKRIAGARPIPILVLTLIN